MNPEENIERAKDKETRTGWNWRQSHVVFLVLPVLCIVLVPLGGFPYLFGRLNWSLTTVCMIYPAIGVLMLYCFFVGIRRLSGGWKRHNERKKLLIAAEIAMPITFVVLFMIPFFYSVEWGLGPPGKTFT